MRESLRDLHEKLGRLIRRGQVAGAINPAIDPEAAGEVLFSSYLGLYLQKAFIPELDIGRYKDVVMALLHGDFTQAT